MREMDLAKADLNLLIVLRSLLETRSVSRSAERLGMSQPAVSRCLARLRRQFGDRLLLKGGHEMMPTARAQELAGPLAALIADAEAFLQGAPAFQPATTDRVFRLATTDFGATAVLPLVLPVLRQKAPHGGLEAVPFSGGVFAMLGSGDLDLMLYSDDPVPKNLRTRDLFVDHYVCLIRRDHPAIRTAVAGQVGMADYLAHDHILATVFGGRGGVIDEALAKLSLTRRVAAWLPYFATAALLAAQSDLILTLPRRAAETFASQLDVVLLRPPVEPAPLVYRMVWHERSHNDAGCAWLREQVVTCLAKPVVARKARAG